MADDEVSQSVRALAKGVSILFVGAIASKAIMYFYRIIVARYLGPADYGLLNLGLAVFWIAVTLSNLGIGSGIQRRVTHHLGHNQEDKVASVMWSSLSLSIPWSIVVASLVFLLSEPIAFRAFHNPASADIIKIFAVAVPFQILYKNGASLIKAYREVKYLTYTDSLVRSLATLIVTVILLWKGYGLMGAVIAQLVAVLIVSVLILYFAEFKVYRFLRRGVSLSERRWLFHYSWPLFLSGIVGLAMSWTDTVLLGFYDTAANVGVYNAAYPTAQLLSLIPAAAGTMLFPMVSEMYSAGKREEAVKVVAVGLKWIFAAVFPGLLIMVLFGGPLLRLLFGQSYTAGSVALAFLGFAYFLQGMTSHAGTFIKAEEWTKVTTLNSAGAAVLNIALNILLIPLYSTAGAGLATAISLTLVSIAATVEVYYLFDVQPYRLRKYIPPAASAVISAVVVFAALRVTYAAVPTLALIPAFALFTCLYGVLYIVLGGLDDNDLMVLRAVDKKTDTDLEPVKEILRRLRKN